MGVTELGSAQVSVIFFEKINKFESLILKILQVYDDFENLILKNLTVLLSFDFSNLKSLTVSETFENKKSEKVCCCLGNPGQLEPPKTSVSGVF